MQSRNPFWVLLAAALVWLPGHTTRGENAPERHEVWVPSKDLETILKEHPNAVLLDRAQYEALIRDAGRVKTDDEKAPLSSVIEGVKLQLGIAGGAPFVLINAKVTVHSLVEGWSEVNLLSLPEGVVLTQFDGKDVAARADEKNSRAFHLLVRGKGRHEIGVQLRSAIQRTQGVCRATIPHLARPLSVSAAATNGARFHENWPVKDGAATVPITDMRLSAPGSSIDWVEGAPANATAPLIIERADSLTNVRAGELATTHRIFLSSGQGPLPDVLRFRLSDAATQVTNVGWWGTPGTAAATGGVSGEINSAAWKQDGAVLEITRRQGFMQAGWFYFETSTPIPDAAKSMAIDLEVPRLEGAARVSSNLGLLFREGLEMGGWQTAGSMPPQDFVTYEQEQRGQGQKEATTFLTHYESTPAKVMVNIRRTSDLFSTDVDLQALVTQHELQLTRTVAFLGEEGSVRRAIFSLPAGEQFLSLAFASGEPIEWKQTDGTAPTLEITWPGTLAKGKGTKVLLSTRKELPPSGVNPPPPLVLENLAIPGATRLAGYLALDFDESWKVATPETTGLESRDARYTPVKGRMAWFHLRDFKLGVTLSRHEPVLDAAITAYALPRSRTVEIEGQIAIESTRAPLRNFTVKLPVDVASLLRWDSPLIGERTLDAATGVWTLGLRKELMGAATLRWHLSLPGEVKTGSDAAAAPAPDPNAPPSESAPNATLAATLPRFELPTARRFTGAWVIEANTDTELSFATKGLQPLDALRAPGVEGYMPRHRVLAAYGYGTAAHELRVTATRHESTRLTSAVVEQLGLISVLARDGTARHEAAMRVRHSGDQFFAVRLPEGSTLLSTSVEHALVKPVTAGPGEVRVPLPRRQGGSGVALITVLYETASKAWGGGGRTTLQPLVFDAAVPVLTTTWRVLAPEGYSYVQPETTLLRSASSETPTLAEVAAGSLERATPFMPSGVSFMPGGYATAAKEVEMVEVSPEYPKPMYVGTPVPQFKTRNPTVTTSAGEPNASLDAISILRQKLNVIILPKVEMNAVTIGDAVQFFAINSPKYDVVERDPAKRGVKITLAPGAEQGTSKITLNLQDVPMGEALRYVTEIAGLKYKIDPTGVVIVPLSDMAAEFYTRTFRVPPNFLEVGGRASAIEVLKANGAPFPEGAAASFDPATSQLIVRNTQANLSMVETVVNALSAPPPADVPQTTGVYGTTASAGAYYSEKMGKLIFPRVQFENASLEEALEFLRIKTRDYDTFERDPAKKGINVIVKPGVAPSQAKITLDLKDVPMDEALKYITELAGMKYKVEPFAVVVTPVSDSAVELYVRTYTVPPTFLELGQPGVVGRGNSPAEVVLSSHGIQFPEGASASFVPANLQLIVKNTQPALDQVEAIVENMGRMHAARKQMTAKTGLLPVKLELSTAGRIFEFRGNQKPEALTLHYQSWERQMAKACFWLLLGLWLFWRLGRTRPWWCTMVVALVLTCLPLALLPTWMAVCNALLAGWLLGFVVWLILSVARWVESRGQEQEGGAFA